MGTSSMYTGYSGTGNNGNPLLPNDFIDDQNPQQQNGDSQQPFPEISSDKKGSWQNAKTLFSKLYSGKSTNYQKALSSYVKAHGGAKTASKSAKSGIKTAYDLGNFVSNSYSLGFKEALNYINVSYENKSLSEVFNEIINVLSPDPITREDSIARKAMIVTIEELYEELESVGFDIEADVSTTNKYLAFALPKYIENYIYERILNDMGSRIECSELTSVEAIKKEEELKDCINAMVSGVFTGRDFLQQSISIEETESLYNQCYTIMEEII